MRESNFLNEMYIVNILEFHLVLNTGLKWNKLDAWKGGLKIWNLGSKSLAPPTTTTNAKLLGSWYIPGARFTTLALLSFQGPTLS